MSKYLASSPWSAWETATDGSAEWEAVLEQVQGCGSVRFVHGGLLCWGGLGSWEAILAALVLERESEMGVAGQLSLFR